jgi:ferredoxin
MPSFMVTREESDSTRGRANALRAVMSGVLPAAELTGPRLYSVMDLCISCKACRAECPSGVDMARLKLEFLARYHEAHGVPLRSRLFAHAGALNRLGGGWRAPLARAALGGPDAAASITTAVVALPGGGRSRPGGGATATLDNAHPALALQPTTGTIQPEVAAWSYSSGSRAGRGRWADDGRRSFQGLLTEGAAGGRGTVDARAGGDAGCQSSAGAEQPADTAREYYLLPGDERGTGRGSANVRRVRIDRGRPGRCVSLMNGAVLLHGHCHQKALVGMGPRRQRWRCCRGVVEEVTPLWPGRFVRL